ncbi:MAG: hypothetical protein ACREPR_25760, partial [Brasilonema sp.]
FTQNKQYFIQLWGNTVELRHLFVETAEGMGRWGAEEKKSYCPIILSPPPLRPSAYLHSSTSYPKRIELWGNFGWRYLR